MLQNIQKTTKVGAIQVTHSPQVYTPGTNNINKIAVHSTLTTCQPITGQQSSAAVIHHLLPNQPFPFQQPAQQQGNAQQSPQQQQQFYAQQQVYHQQKMLTPKQMQQIQQQQQMTAQQGQRFKLQQGQMVQRQPAQLQFKAQQQHGFKQRDSPSLSGGPPCKQARVSTPVQKPVCAMQETINKQQRENNRS